MSTNSAPQGVEIIGAASDATAEILTPDALAFVAALHRAHNSRRKELLAKRVARAEALANGVLPDFLPETARHPRRRLDGSPHPGGPAGPADRDHRPGRPQDDHQRAQLGRQGLHGRLRGLQHADLGQHDRGPDQPARRGRPARSVQPARRQAVHAQRQRSRRCWCGPRGWHLVEKHVLVDGEPISASLFDFGLYFFHNHAELKRQGTGPYFYLPEDGEPPRSAPVERRVHPGPGRARRAAGHRSRARC